MSSLVFLVPCWCGWVLCPHLLQLVSSDRGCSRSGCHHASIGNSQGCPNVPWTLDLLDLKGQTSLKVSPEFCLGILLSWIGLESTILLWLISFDRGCSRGGCHHAPIGNSQGCPNVPWSLDLLDLKGQTSLRVSPEFHLYHLASVLFILKTRHQCRWELPQ